MTRNEYVLARQLRLVLGLLKRFFDAKTPAQYLAAHYATKKFFDLETGGV